MRAMRWLAMLSLAACATPGWTTYAEVTDQSRPAVVGRLRGAEGEAMLVAGDRCYIVRPGALQSEIRAFACALADAIESPGASDVDPSPVPAESDPVIALPWLDRALSIGQVSIESYRTERGTHYRTSVELQPERHVGAQVRGTAAIDAAWEKLAGAARAQAVFWNVVRLGPSFDYVRIAGGDFRSAGGPPEAASR